MKSIRVAISIVAVLVVTVASGCAATPPTDPAGIVGEITSLESTELGLSMLVEGGEQPEGAVSDKAQVTVDESTEVFDPDGSIIDADQLTVGDPVTVWFEGPVAESYPVQGTASAVQLSPQTP